MLGNTLKTTALPVLNPMSPFLDNGLPAVIYRFGKSDDQEVPFSCHLESCAAMNTYSLLLHVWIITSYPEIVHSYEQYDDDTPP